MTAAVAARKVGQQATTSAYRVQLMFSTQHGKRMQQRLFDHRCSAVLLTAAVAAGKVAGPQTATCACITYGLLSAKCDSKSNSCSHY